MGHFLHLRCLVCFSYPGLKTRQICSSLLCNRTVPIFLEPFDTVEDIKDLFESACDNFKIGTILERKETAFMETLRLLFESSTLPLSMGCDSLSFTNFDKTIALAMNLFRPSLMGSVVSKSVNIFKFKISQDVK